MSQKKSVEVFGIPIHTKQIEDNKKKFGGPKKNSSKGVEVFGWPDPPGRLEEEE